MAGGNRALDLRLRGDDNGVVAWRITAKIWTKKREPLKSEAPAEFLTF
jgi:hypothetical protein